MPSATSWISLLVLTACSTHAAGVPGGDATAATPAAPGQLTVTGSLRNIHLQWSAPAGAAGYHVYRSADGTEFIWRTDTPATATSYDDPIDSPAGDGVRYSYRVTAVDVGGARESASSNIAGTMHGTRLQGPYTDPGEPEQSPYVVEGITVFDSDVTMEPATTLYVLPGAVLDFRAGAEFEVHGVIRATGSPSAPILFTAHSSAGQALLHGQGFWFSFQGEGSGSVLDHVRMDHLDVGPLGGGIIVESGGLKLHDVKLRSDGTCLLLKSPVTLEDSFLDKVSLCFAANLGTSLQVTRNVFRHAPIIVDRFTSTPAGPGQIANNDLDGVAGVSSDGGSLPVGGNYWAGASGTPPVPSGTAGAGSAADFNNPGPALAEPPAAGPDW